MSICVCCGQEARLFYGLCDRCFGYDLEYCEICQFERQVDTDMPCRHLYFTQRWGWLGCGSTHEESEEIHHQSFLLLLRLMCTYELARKLQTALTSGGYGIYVYSIQVVPPDRLCLQLDREDLGPMVEQLPDQEEIRPAILWLRSLQHGRTSEAEQMTLRWIDEFLRS